MKVQDIEIKDTSVAEINRIFDLQRANQLKLATSTLVERRAKLDKLLKVFLAYRSKLKNALYADSGKHPTEADIIEIYSVTGEIKHAKRNLREWVARHKVPTSLAFIGSSSYITYQAKGVVLIISPWNFPVNLTIGPLVSAIAAGNAAMLKPSEYSPHTSAVMNEMLQEIFSEDEVALIEGGVKTSTELLKLPFNHIFFTGSPAIGKIVMAAAAENLTSVTLELGGKTPTIVDSTANLKTAARRTMWSKFSNVGQICIAPDHVYVHESRINEFIELSKKYLIEFYSNDPEKEPSLARVVNKMNVVRLRSLLTDAVDRGARIEHGGEIDESDNFVSPTLVTKVSNEMRIMQDEIFGPILPIIPFRKVEEVVDKLNQEEIPLALYIYSRNNKTIDFILSNTKAGNSCVNHNGTHFYNHYLPFGGANNSGIGKSHGWHGFQEFSNARGIYRQHIPGPLELLTPPYNKFKQWLIDFTIKWL